ncbi:MAG: class I SAM-dependent methyltransferase [Lachnospiraceae bacterium]|nr:class I SAM-dependent methyltransferase [Lachnospiraceae bacterium]
MTEQIGKIKLDLTLYPGEDFYCDGQVEDELLEITKNYAEVEYPRIIEERASWPVLYHLSRQRENTVDWIPMRGDEKVLEIGSGCGAITGVLARKAGQVTCVDLSKKRSMINAYRHGECDNVTIHVGNFKDIEPTLPKDFDYIFLIGVFEYGQSYMGSENPFEEFLRIIMKHLKRGGRVVIAIENKYGLKYFAGCKEDHLGTYFSSIENYARGGGVRTFSAKGLEKLFAACGIKKYHFYYPYPDYKFMTHLYSDDYLPKKGELLNNIRNFDRERMLLFDESWAFDGIAEDNLFSVFANSYLVVIGNGFDIKYAKYSNDRAPEYCIRTEIWKDKAGVTTVKKHPLCKEAKEHIRGMALAYDNLKKRYEGGSLEINKCDLHEEENALWCSFEFLEGRPLSQILDECLEKDEQERFHALFREYVERTGYHADYPVADFDLIFGNIIVQGDIWTAIDYEWTFGKQVDTKELAFRSIYCYLLENEKRNKLNLDLILEELKITPEEAEYYREQEREFQKFVTGKSRSMIEIRDLIGNRLLQPMKWLEKLEAGALAGRVQIYEDRGSGFSEDASYFVSDAYQGEQEIELELKVDGNVKSLRIDPAMDACTVRIVELTWNGTKIPLQNKKIFTTNGKSLKPADAMVFATKDPNLCIKLSELATQPENILCAKLEIARLPVPIAEAMTASVKKLI